MDALVVVERAGSLAGAWAGHLLAGAGARVLKVGERESAATVAPRGEAYFDAAKEVVAADGPDLDALLTDTGADVLVESSAQGPLRPHPVGTDLDRLVTVRISPFGSDGPYSAWRASDLVIQAAGGYVHLSGDPQREPLQAPGNQADLAAGCFGAIGALAALAERDRSGQGQLVEVAVQDTLAALHQFTEVRFTHAGDVLQRMGNRYAGPGSPIGMYRAKDGDVALTVATAAHMEVLLAVTGLEHLLERPDVESIVDVMVRNEILVPPLLEWLAQRTVAEVVELFQSVRIAAAPVLTMHQLLDDPQLTAREFWRPLDVSGREVRVPGPPFLIEGRPWPTGPGGDAPSPTASDRTARRFDVDSTRTSGAGSGTGSAGDGPLAGVRVLDLTRVWAGPLAARILADLGADVVMVEAPWARTTLIVPDSYVRSSHFYPDDEAGEHPWNRNGFINKFALGKRSVALDMTDPEGLAAFERLVAGVDVVIENFSPRVMPNFGLDEGRLLELNPHLLYVTMPGYGRTGPAVDYSAYGPVLDSHAGLSTLMGYRELDAWKCGIAWPDPVGGIHGALAVLLALRDRDAQPDRPGRTIEIAQFETAVAMVGDRLVEAQLDGTDPPLPGNRHPLLAPQGVYPSAGEDRWIAVTVPDDAAWARLCDLAGLSAGWARWTVEERRARHDEIDEALAAWTARREHRELAAELQAGGVPASAVLDGAELVGDPNLVERHVYVPVTHPEAGTHLWPCLPARLSGADTAPRGPAPLLGEHNAEVLVAWAGLTAAGVEALEDRSVLATRPPS